MYLPFIGVLIIAIAFISIMVPETKNRTFDEIAQSISKGGKGKGDGMLNHEGEEMQPMKAWCLCYVGYFVLRWYLLNVVAVVSGQCFCDCVPPCLQDPVTKFVCCYMNVIVCKQCIFKNHILTICFTFIVNLIPLTNHTWWPWPIFLYDLS